MFLVVADEDRTVDLKTLHTRIGASGRVGFAAPDQMRDVPVSSRARLPRLADTAKAASVVCETVHVDGEEPYKAIIETTTSKKCDLMSWRRTGEAAFPRSFSPARPSRCLPIRRFRF